MKKSQGTDFEGKDIIIRRAKAADVAVLYGLARKFSQIGGSEEMDGYTRQEIFGWMKDKDKIWLVALTRKGSKFIPIGFLFAIFISHDWCMVDGFGVEDGWRRQGVGRRLLAEIEKICRAKKINYLQAYSEAGNKTAEKFWENYGFSKGKKFRWFDKKL